jgi:hypothetical protein
MAGKAEPATASSRAKPSAVPRGVHLTPSDTEGLTAVIGGANPLIGLSRPQVAASAGRWARHLLADPAVAIDHGLRLAGHVARIAVGGGHMFLLDQPREAADIVGSFLRTDHGGDD